MAKVLCVLYDDPVDGYPTTYARDGLPRLERYPDGQSLPTPEAIDFTPGDLLGSVSGELGLRRFLESAGAPARRHLRQGRRRTRRSTASCPTPTSSSRSRSGRPISPPSASRGRRS